MNFDSVRHVTLPRRGRPREDGWLRQVYEYLQAHRNEPRADQIAADMGATEPRVRAALKQLKKLGYVDGSKIIQEELLPAYLFLRVPARSMSRVDRFVASLRPLARHEVHGVQFSCDVLVQLRVFDMNAVHFLCERARREGADSASGVVLKAS